MAEISWNNLNKLESFKALKEFKEPVSLAKALKGASGAKRVAECSIPMAGGLVYNYAAKQVSKQLVSAFKKIVKEARLPVMWAIDYRDFRTAIHGLYYGKNRRDVEKFYDRIKVIYDDKDMSPEEQEMLYQELWDEFYPRVQKIDEINFRDIGKLPSGKYGIVIDDVEYRLVNPMAAIDLYEESTKRGSKMKFKKIVGESRDWEKYEASMSWKFEIRNKKELDELYGIIHRAT